LQLNGTHQLLVHADDFNILGENVHTIQENAEALIGASKGIELQVKADKTWSCLAIRMQDEDTV
jgi:hypothetical protein